ncbi:MAG TPA: AI-2E family transporter [Burkholderiales bacterium]|nr:AI-2E family transporter [Burkholderiales bacterium]
MSRHFETYARPVAAFLLVVGCFLVLQPFITALLFAVVIVVSTWPLYLRLRAVLKQRSTLAALVMSLLFAALVITPVVLLAVSLGKNAPDMVETVKEWLAAAPSGPPDWLKTLPVVGNQIDAYWHRLAVSREELAAFLKQFLDPAQRLLLAVGKGLGQGLLQLSLAVFVAFFLFRDGDALREAARGTLERVAGPVGEEVLETIDATIVGVVYGILGTALAQGLVATIGFLIAGVPGPLLLGAVTFLFSLVPVGPPLIWGAATVWLVNQGEIGWGIFMALWGFFGISGIDNIVKPLLISRGANLPFALVLLGVFGGVLAFGFIGVFLGPIFLAVGWGVGQWWLTSSHHSGAAPHVLVPDRGAQDKLTTTSWHEQQ